MHSFTLDTSCVLNLFSPGDVPNGALVELLKAGLDGRVALQVTEVVAQEVPAEPAKYALRARVSALRVLAVTAARRLEAAQLAEKLFRELWPNAVDGSASSEHGRRDARHLADHLTCGGSIFVTLDLELARKAKTAPSLASALVLRPEEALPHVSSTSATKPPVVELEDVIIRPAKESDAAAIATLMDPIRDLYPRFDEWRHKALREKQCFVGCIDDAVVGISVWEPKVPGVIKLATFYVGPDYRGLGLGPHLLFHQLRTWARERAQKVFVTVSSRVKHVVPFFLGFGFRVEGTSPRRYGTDEVEIVLGKHFVHEVLGDAGLPAFQDRLRPLLTEVPELFGLTGDEWFMRPARRPDRVAAFDALTQPALEELFFPLRVSTSGRKAYLIPIRPEWADRLVQWKKPQPELFFGPEKLLLRTDNAYYCHPRYGPAKLRGEHALFYVSGDAGMIAGTARMLECIVDFPEELYLTYGDLGIYRPDDLRGHVKSSGKDKGKAMALHFGWWLPFEQPIPLSRMRALGVAAPQTITAVPFDQFLRLCAEGEGTA